MDLGKYTKEKRKRERELEGESVCVQRRHKSRLFRRITPDPVWMT